MESRQPDEPAKLARELSACAGLTRPPRSKMILMKNGRNVQAFPTPIMLVYYLSGVKLILWIPLITNFYQ